MEEEFNKQNHEELIEEREVEVMEFSLVDDEIDELIAKLQLLKESKEQIHFEVDEANDFVIHYEESNCEDEEDESEEDCE